LKPEKLSLIRELCYIAHKRNEINHRRSKARWRKSYYQKALKIVEAFKEDSSELRKVTNNIKSMVRVYDVSQLEKRQHQIKFEMAQVRIAWLKQHENLPKKWINMGSMKLRAMILKSEAEYARSKYDTMVFSEKTTKRVKDILKALGARLHYDNGYVTAVSSYANDLATDRTEIAEYSKEFELSKAIDNMLRK
jgi:hypothetical protein